MKEYFERYEPLHPLVEDALQQLGERIGVNSIFFALNDLQHNFIIKALNKSETLIEEGSTHVFQSVLCQLVVEDSSEVLAIEDLRNNPGTREHPVTVAIGEGSFLGVAVKNADNETIGTLCAFDSKPYRFEQGQIDEIRRFSEIISKSISVETYAIKDALTDLYNERYMNRLIAMPGTVPAFLMVLNLDNFHQINASYGYRVGNSILQTVAKRLTALDLPKQSIGRTDGNEFVVLVPVHGKDVSETGREYAERVIECINRPIVGIASDAINLTASSGVSYLSPDRIDRERQIYAAESLMYQVKMSGKNGVQFVNGENENERNPFSLILQKELPLALERNEFELHYQAVFDASSLEVVAYETLLRWNHPILGFVPPNDFLPVAEKMGLLEDISLFVFEQIAEQRRNWSTEPRLSVPLAFNLSSAVFTDDSFIDVLCQRYVASGFDDREIILEIREDSLIEDMMRSIDTLNRLRSAGFGLTIDHFGSRYASLNRLGRLPVDTVKLDPLFTRRIERNKLDQSILASVHSLTRLFGLNLVIQEVETSYQLKTIQNQGERLYVQGFHLHRPETADSLTKGRHQEKLTHDIEKDVSPC